MSTKRFTNCLSKRVFWTDHGWNFRKKILLTVIGVVIATEVAIPMVMCVLLIMIGHILPFRIFHPISHSVTIPSDYSSPILIFEGLSIFVNVTVTV